VLAKTRALMCREILPWLAFIMSPPVPPEGSL